MTDIISSKYIYEGHIINLRLEKINLGPGNKEKRLREVVEHNAAVAIVPIDDHENILFVRQYRHPTKEHLLEVPAGIIEKGEHPADTAMRELQEEIGYKAGKMKFLAKIHPAIGFANEIMSVFLAENLEKTNHKRDKDEFLEIMPTELDKSLDLIWENKITDVKTIIGLLWLQKIIDSL